LMRQQWQQASDYLVSEIESAPDDANTWISMGSMFLTIDDLDYATHCLMKAVNIDCANPDAYYYLGLLSTLKGWFEDALDFFTQTLEYNGEHVGALRSSALIYLTMGRLSEAEHRIREALHLTDDPQLRALKRKVRLLQAIEDIKNFLSPFHPRYILPPLSRFIHRK
jgi:tetratricopeptide (TPR) repeat protein